MKACSNKKKANPTHRQVAGFAFRGEKHTTQPQQTAAACILHQCTTKEISNGTVICVCRDKITTKTAQKEARIITSPIITSPKNSIK